MLFPIFASKSHGFQTAFWSDFHWLSRQPVPGLHTKGTRSTKGTHSPLPARIIKLQGLIHCSCSFQAGKLLLPGRFVMLLCHLCKVSCLLSKVTGKSTESCATNIHFLVNELHQENLLSIISTWHKVCLKKTEPLIVRAKDNKEEGTDKLCGLGAFKTAWMWEVCIWLKKSIPRVLSLLCSAYGKGENSSLL